MANTDAALTAPKSDAAVTVEILAALTPVTQSMLDQLVVQSGWNQTPQDWAIFSREGSLCAVRDARGHIIASGAVLPLGEQVAWISMILVAPEARGRAIKSGSGPRPASPPTTCAIVFTKVVATAWCCAILAGDDAPLAAQGA